MGELFSDTSQTPYGLLSGVYAWFISNEPVQLRWVWILMQIRLKFSIILVKDNQIECLPYKWSVCDNV